MKILNLYSGILGNRLLWGDEDEVTNVEMDEGIVSVSRQLCPNDTFVVGDAHDFLLRNLENFDFIWSSPPCPTHSKVSLGLQGWGIVRYPDMALYQEIIVLQQFFKGKWVVENVEPYYEPLIRPTIRTERHMFWSNFHIPPFVSGRDFNVTDATKEELEAYHGIKLPEGTKNARKLLRNAVYPPLGLHVLNASITNSLFAPNTHKNHDPLN